MSIFTKQRGVSLIELLIVIAIIILLALVSIFALNSQYAKARDAKRISDIRQIRTALEFYKSDEGQYPIEANPIVLGSKEKSKLCSKNSGGFVPADTVCKEETNYMSKVFADPLAGRNYLYTGSADGFDITFTTERASNLGLPGTYHAHSQTIDSISGNN